MLSGEGTNTNFWFLRSNFKPTIYRTRCNHANHYNIDAVEKRSKTIVLSNSGQFNIVDNIREMSNDYCLV